MTAAGGRPRAGLHSLRARLLAALLPVLALAAAASLVGLDRFLAGFLAEQMERETAALAEAIKASIQEQMLRRAEGLTQRALEEVGATGQFRRLMIVDRRGRVAHAFPAAERGRVVDPADERCRACHPAGGGAAARSALVTDTAGERVYQLALPLVNEPRCHGCHGAAARLNGVLVLERPAGREAAVLGAVRRRLGLTWLGLSVVLACLVGIVATVVVHRPVRRLIAATRRIGAGDLATRVPVAGRGEVAELAAAFNTMASRLAGSLEAIRQQGSELFVLYSIVDRVSRTVVLAELEPVVLETVAEVLGATRVALVSSNRTPGELEIHERLPDGRLARCPASAGAPASTVPAGVLDRWRAGALEGVQFHERDGVTTLALGLGGVSTGLLVVWPSAARPVGCEDVRLLRALRDHVSVAFENARLYTLAITDDLTGLYSQRHFRRSLEEAVGRCRRYGEPVSLLMLDVDHFKAVNDAYGHPAGDRALREVARRLRRCLREVDLPCRYGGEEFAVILPHTDVAGALHVAERVRAAVEDEPLALARGVARRITVSIGVAACPRDGVTAQGLVDAADAALLQAKRAGRNRVAVAAG